MVYSEQNSLVLNGLFPMISYYFCTENYFPVGKQNAGGMERGTGSLSKSVFALLCRLFSVCILKKEKIILLL